MTTAREINTQIIDQIRNAQDVPQMRAALARITEIDSLNDLRDAAPGTYSDRRICITIGEDSDNASVDLATSFDYKTELLIRQAREIDAPPSPKRTGRPPLDLAGSTRVTVTMPNGMIRDLSGRSFTQGSQSTQIRKAVEEYLSGGYGAPTVTATKASDPADIVNQVSDVLAYLQRVSSTISQTAGVLRWMGDDESEHRFDAAIGAIGELYAALSEAEAPYAQRAREAACAAIPEDV